MISTADHRFDDTEVKDLVYLSVEVSRPSFCERIVP